MSSLLDDEESSVLTGFVSADTEVPVLDSLLLNCPAHDMNWSWSTREKLILRNTLPNQNLQSINYDPAFA